MTSQPGQHYDTFRLEQLPIGNSQQHPSMTPRDVQYDIGAESMAMHWEYMYNRERGRSMQQGFVIDKLRHKIRQGDSESENMQQKLYHVDIELKHLTQIHERLLQSVQEDAYASKYGQAPYPEANALSPTMFMPPPSSFQDNKPMHGTKRSLEIPSTEPRKRQTTGLSSQRQARDNLSLMVDFQVSPRGTIFSPKGTALPSKEPFFSPSTPTAMKV